MQTKVQRRKAAAPGHPLRWPVQWPDGGPAGSCIERESRSFAGTQAWPAAMPLLSMSYEWWRTNSAKWIASTGRLHR